MKLYKGEENVSTIEVNDNASETNTLTYDFSTLMNEKGYGSYTFTVKAIVASGKTSYYESSAESAKSEAKAYNESITISSQPTGVTKVYNGTVHKLEVGVPSSAGTVTYQWYKDNSAIQNATSSSYEVKNATDSGEYYVKISNAAGEKLDSSKVTVSITKLSLTVTADDKTIAYGGAAPDYTYTATGFLEGEDATSAGLQAGSLTCTYDLTDPNNNGAKTYPIVPAGFTADNYDITYKNGMLTVGIVDVNAEGSSVTVEITDAAPFAYTGEEIKPAISVKNGENTIDDANYGVIYSNNVNVGKEALITVTFKNNYKGTLTKNFEITKGNFTATVSLANWTYGDTPNDPSIDTNPSGGEVTYYYQKANTDTNIPKPTEAGEYTVYAVIAEHGGYNACTTEEKAFSILKRPITLTSESQTWDYDGNSHSNTSHTQVGNFIGTDSFQSVVVSGTITNVGEVDNDITYTLSSSTKADNYEITLVKGRLKVTAKALTVPANHRFSTSNPGTAQWVAVTRNDLDVTYELQLYRVEQGDGGNVSNDVLVDTVTTTGTEYDFAAAIRADAASIKNTESSIGEAAGYYFTIQAIPSGGTAKNNYTESEVSANSANIYTAKVKLVGNAGVSAVGFETASAAEVEKILLQGESIGIAATNVKGYTLHETVWTTDNTSIAFTDATKATTNLKVSASLTAPITEAVVYASADDEKPVIGSFTATANDAKNEITFSLSASDTKLLTHWMITTAEDTPRSSDAGWQEVASSDIAEGAITKTQTANTAGTYYAWVKDDGENIVSANASIHIYEITFDAGTGDTSTAKASILKVENTAIVLPENSYTKAGFTFKNWTGSTGIYANGGGYAANANDTLTAQWTNELFSYDVAYYYMDTNGNYKDTPDKTVRFQGAYNAEINSSDAAIQQPRIGMERDTEPDKQDAITLTNSNQTIKVYYKRQQYTITYTYKLLGAEDDTTKLVKYDYGETVAEETKPTADGYVFVGWLYGDAGTKPETMPNNNINATGFFKSDTTEYKVVYYEKNLEGDDYTLVEALTETKSAVHGDKITAENINAKQIDGFTVAGVVVSEGAAGGSSQSGTLPVSVTGTVSAIDNKQLYINYYYTRNTYSLTLNVWKGNRDTANSLYSKEWTDIPYGKEITTEEATNYANYEKESWDDTPNNVEGYELADYVDWSTGAAPNLMPAGNVTVNRDYVSKTISSYQIEVYFEDAEPTTYTKAASLTYYANVGTTINIVGEGEENSQTINYNTFGQSIYGFKHYEFASTFVDDTTTEDVIEGNILTGEVTDSNKVAPLVLKVYFNRREVTTTITYYYNDSGAGSTNTVLATVTKKGKWGTNYEYDPLALFGGNSEIPTSWQTTGNSYSIKDVLVDGSTPQNYDFKANNYVVNYAGYYELNDTPHWPSHKFDAVEDLSGSYSGLFGQSKDYSNQKENYINVYYTKVLPTAHYYVNVMYNPSKLKKSGDVVNHPLQVTIGETTYNIRIANKADVLEVESTTHSANTDAYPGIGGLPSGYTYGTGIQEGFGTVEYNEATYYTKVENGINYLYVLDDKNQFYKGNRVSYNYYPDTSKPAPIGYDTITTYLTDYQTTQAAQSEGERDSKYAAAYIYNGGFSPIMYGNGTYVFTFDYKPTFTLTHKVGSTTCSGHEHVSGVQIETIECAHESAFGTKPEGYSIVWYKDAIYTTKATNVDFKITSNTTLFGRYEKNTLDNHAYVSYQLANPLGTSESPVSYITKENLSIYSTQLKKVTVQETIPDFEDEFGRKVNLQINLDKYYYPNTEQGELVLIDRTIKSLSFKELQLDFNSETYQKEGFHYDITNTSNQSHGYCQAEPISLSACFARDNYSIEIIKNKIETTSSEGGSELGGTETGNTENSDVEIRDVVYGQTVSIEAPLATTKPGYTFTGWEWKKWVEPTGEGTEGTGQWVTWESAPTLVEPDKNVSFTMPALKLQATAKWEPADLKPIVTHYYQGENQTYNTSLLENVLAAKEAGNTNAATVTYSDSSGSEYNGTGTLYYSDAFKTTLISLSIELNGCTVFFSRGQEKEGTWEVDAANLFAAQKEISVKSGVALNNSNFVQNVASGIFSYAYTIYQNDKTVLTFQGGVIPDGSTAKYTYDMQLSSYYTRANNLNIQAVGMATDAGNNGVAILGAGTHYYGENVEMKATVASGYDFLGWYIAADVLVDYPTEGKALSEYSLKTDIRTESPISANATYAFQATED